MAVIEIDKQQRPPVRVDENSSAVKILRKFQFFSNGINGVTNIDQHRQQAREDGVSFDDYVRLYQLTGAKTELERSQIEASFYGDNSLTTWLRYQQTYIIKQSLIIDCSEELQKPFSIKNIQLPFPAIFAIMEFPDTPKNAGHSLSFLICQRGERFDVTAFVDDTDFYFPLTKEVLARMAEGTEPRCTLDEMHDYCMHLAWYLIEFLSIYRRNPKIISIRKIRVGGEGDKAKRVPSEWYVLNDRIMKQLLPPPSAPLDGALKPIGLIPPSERPDELVHIKGTHKSPEEHWVVTHTRTYWTGKGRKIPVKKTIQTFKRGKPSESGETPGTTRICE